MAQRVAIVGWGQSRHQRERREVNLGELIHETVKKTLATSGIDIRDIDCVIGASCDTLDGRSISNVFVVESMGGFLKEESKVEEDGAYAAFYALMRLRAGPNRTILVVAHSKGSESSPQTYSHLICDPFYMRPLGIEAITASALQARRFMARSKVTAKHVARVAVKNRLNGLSNPHAHAGRRITVEDVLSSPVLASPIHKEEASPVSDGCAVLVLAAGNVARRYAKRPVWIEGAGLSNCLYYLGHRDLGVAESARAAARAAYTEAGIRNPRRQIDFAEVTEPFAFQELMLYEALGLCKEGESGKLVDSGATQIGGKFPVNPSGGALSANPILAAGLVRMIEAAAQLSGRAGEHQLPGAPRRALVHATSGLCLQSNIVYVLGTDA